MNTTKTLSVEAVTIMGAFAMYLKQPQLVEPYKNLAETDLLTLVNGTSIANGDKVNKLAAELGWVNRAGYGWSWNPTWIQELKEKKQLAYFYVMVKAMNEAIEAQRPRTR